MKADILQLIVSSLTFLGIGGIIGGYVTHLLAKKKELEFQVLEQKQKRYRSCLLFMDAYLVPDNAKYVASRHPDISGPGDVLQYLKAEYHEMLLYAPVEVALSLKQFIDSPSSELFLKTILYMRHDLWIKKADLKLEQVTLQSFQKKLGADASGLGQS